MKEDKENDDDDGRMNNNLNKISIPLEKLSIITDNEIPRGDGGNDDSIGSSSTERNEEFDKDNNNNDDKDNLNVNINDNQSISRARPIYVSPMNRNPQTQEIVAEENNNNHNNNHKEEEEEKGDTDDNENEEEGESWELTWPIWHMLPRSERRTIALRNGYKNIGDFEEHMTLSRALIIDDPNHKNGQTNSSHTNTNSNTNSNTNKNHNGNTSYDSSLMYELENSPGYFGLPTVAEPGSTINNNTIINTKDNINNTNNQLHKEDTLSDNEECEDEQCCQQIANDNIRNNNSNDNHNFSKYNNNNNNNHNNNNALDEHDHDNKEQTTPTTTPSSDNDEDEKTIISEGGLILLLPTHLILHNILSHLDIEYYATCSLVSKRWHTFSQTQEAYREACKRCYLRQSKRKVLHVHNFQNSYKCMLERRPRVKTGGGLYVMKYSKIRKIQRDMWTEIPVGAILETTYYRYMYFREDGRVLYALTSSPPHEIIPRFAKLIVSSSSSRDSSGSSGRNKSGSSHKDQKAMVWGTYVVQKYNVTVNVEHTWHHVRIGLRLLEDGCEGSRGRFWAMSFETHTSSVSGNFDEYYSTDLVEYKVPPEPFRFLRDWRL